MIQKSKNGKTNEKNFSKLHLGCGQTYLEGYLNIDLPPSNHTIQKKSVADLYANLLELSFERETVEEGRNHHVFEHFTRPVALAILANWNRWLKMGGVLRIEVPDFERTARQVLSPFVSKRDKCVGLRHIFGSNEASWAVHYEGWTKPNLHRAFQTFGFEVINAKRAKYKATHNLDIQGKKVQSLGAAPEVEALARNYLQDFLVDESEKEMLDLWLSDFRNVNHL